jgi:hypothetical protein
VNFRLHSRVIERDEFRVNGMLGADRSSGVLHGVAAVSSLVVDGVRDELLGLAANKRT